jgi:hypothetical protein
MADTRDGAEFHIIVRRPGSRGPLSPYRFAITVAFSLLVAGTDLWEAFHGLRPVDDALIKAAIAGLMSWIVLGLADSILRSTPPHRIVRTAAPTTQGPVASTPPNRPADR